MRVSCVSSSTLQLLLEPHNGFGEVMRPGTLAGATGRRGETPRAKLAPAVSFVSQTVLCLSFGIHAPILTNSRVSQLCHFTKLHVIRVNLYSGCAATIQVPLSLRLLNLHLPTLSLFLDHPLIRQIRFSNVRLTL